MLTNAQDNSQVYVCTDIIKLIDVLMWFDVGFTLLVFKMFCFL
jgi:hypothetical protein